MPWLAALLSFVAITAIGFGLRRYGDPKPEQLGEDQALALFRVDNPLVESSCAILSADGETALIMSPAGGIVGCLHAQGAHWTSRRIGARDIHRVVPHGSQLVIRFTDFSWPGLQMGWTNADEARDWAERFELMRRPDHA